MSSRWKCSTKNFLSAAKSLTKGCPYCQQHQICFCLPSSTEIYNTSHCLLWGGRGGGKAACVHLKKQHLGNSPFCYSHPLSLGIKFPWTFSLYQIHQISPWNLSDEAFILREIRYNSSVTILPPSWERHDCIHKANLLAGCRNDWARCPT